MKAVVNERYGSPDVLEIRHVPRPEPKAGEVLIRVHATTVSRTDCGMLRPLPPVIAHFFTGLLRPKCTILGMDFAGTIEAGKVRAVIDREYPFEAIADAYRFVETAQKTGIVVINVIPADRSTAVES